MYYTLQKEDLYVGLPCERRVENYGYEICCSIEIYEMYCNSATKDISEHSREGWIWEPHILTEKEYNTFMAYTGDLRNGSGLPTLGFIRGIK